MKTIKYIALGVLATSMTLANTSCSDSFLEVENPSGENLEEYYTTDAHINEALNAAYDPIHWPDWGLGQYNALNIDAEIMGDNFWVGGSNKTDMQNWHMLANYEANANNTLSSLWLILFTFLGCASIFSKTTVSRSSWMVPSVKRARSEATLATSLEP